MCAAGLQTLVLASLSIVVMVVSTVHLVLAQALPIHFISTLLIPKSMPRAITTHITGMVSPSVALVLYEI